MLSLENLFTTMYRDPIDHVQAQLDALEQSRPSYVSPYTVRPAASLAAPPVNSSNTQKERKTGKCALIGFSGFVGQNLMAQANFTHLYRSTNVDEIQGESFDMVVCAGLPAAKWIANKDPEADRQIVEGLATTLSSVSTAKFVLISTIDVYGNLNGTDESYNVRQDETHAYGTNRRWFEHKMLELFGGRCHIVRLPALFGPHLKKNYIYDLLHKRLDMVQNITPNTVFQWYDMKDIWADLTTVLQHNIPLVNLFPEPLTTADWLESCFPEYLCNVKGPAEKPLTYNCRTQYGHLFGGPPGFMRSSAEILEKLEAFCSGYVSGDPLLDGRLTVSNIGWEPEEQKAVLQVLALKGVTGVEVTSPLRAILGGLTGHATLNAIAARHNVTSAQVALRWINQLGVAIATR